MSLKQYVRNMPYTSFNWKFNPNKDDQIIKEKEPILAPPLTNTSDVANTAIVSTFLNAAHTHGKPNPIKHWRKQYSTTSPSVMGRPVPVKNNMAVINDPGYTTVSQNKGHNVADCNDRKKCQSSPLAPDYMVAYRNKNAKDNVFGQGIKVAQRNPSGAIEYERCVGICDPERAARRRTQYPSAVNTQVYTNENELCYNKSKYNQSNAEYMRSRCRTYNQNMANKKSSIKPWEAKETDCAACPGECGTGNICNSSCKKKIIYKPNNYKFSQQGAASSSSGIQRKKYNTIQRFAAQFAKPGFKGLYGDATAAAYAYSSNANTPFTIKDKTFTDVQCRTTFNACYKSKNINKTSYN
jgi:hypothetical protein